MLRLAIVTSHPIQYQAPWFRELATQTDLRVFFCHRQDEHGQAAAGYGQSFTWDVPLLDGYRHTFLANVSKNPGVFAFRGCDTPGIHDALATGSFDACIVNGWYLKSYVQAMVACRRLGIPVFLRGDSQRASDRPWLTRALKYPIYRTLLASVTGHLYVGEANRQYLSYYGVPAERLYFVPHCVDDRWFASRADDARRDGAVNTVRARLGVGDGQRIALFVGRLVDQKRPLDFVEAVARARRSRPLVGVVVGSGPLGDQMAALSNQRQADIRFAGFANQSELPTFYAAAQMLVLPSDAGETWGLVANEALSCGTPIVVSDHCGCAHDLVSPDTGRSFACSDVAALEHAMLDVDAERQAAPERMMLAARTMGARYGAASAAAATVAALEQALARARHASIGLTQSAQS